MEFSSEKGGNVWCFVISKHWRLFPERGEAYLCMKSGEVGTLLRDWRKASRETRCVGRNGCRSVSLSLTDYSVRLPLSNYSPLFCESRCVCTAVGFSAILSEMTVTIRNSLSDGKDMKPCSGYSYSAPRTSFPQYRNP